MKQEQRCLVIDGDDTLWPNVYKYHQVEAEILLFLTQKFKEHCWPLRTILDLNDKLDTSIVSRHGLSKVRFPTSWVKTYRAMCRALGVRPSRDDERVIYDLAVGFWRPPFNFFPGVVPTLKELRRRGYYLVLLTAGDPEVQQFKINEVGASKYFDRIIITPRSKAHVLARLVRKFGRFYITMIGDSKKSDMEAAIEAQIRGIYVCTVKQDWTYANGFKYSMKDWQKYIIQIRRFSQLLKLFH